MDSSALHSELVSHLLLELFTDSLRNLPSRFLEISSVRYSFFTDLTSMSESFTDKIQAFSSSVTLYGNVADKGGGESNNITFSLFHTQSLLYLWLTNITGDKTPSNLFILVTS